jgi:hypothetical protein
MKSPAFLASAVLAVGFAPFAFAPVAFAEDRVGIEICDTFLDKYQTCVKEKAGDQRAELEKMIVQMRAQWKQLADDPQTKSTLEQACKQTIETVKPTLNAEPYKCGF